MRLINIIHSSLMQSCSGSKISDVRVDDTSAMHPWPINVQTSQTVANEQNGAACVLKACQTQCQGLLPQQTLNCHSDFSPRGLKDSQDT